MMGNVLETHSSILPMDVSLDAAAHWMKLIYLSEVGQPVIWLLSFKFPLKFCGAWPNWATKQNQSGGRMQHHFARVQFAASLQFFLT
jgi:hypothetical protein